MFKELKENMHKEPRGNQEKMKEQNVNINKEAEIT